MYAPKWINKCYSSVKTSYYCFIGQLGKGSWKFKPSPSYPRKWAPSDKRKVYKVSINITGQLFADLDQGQANFLFNLFYVWLFDYSIPPKASDDWIHKLITLHNHYNHGLIWRQLLDHNSKLKELNFSPSLGFELGSPGNQSQCSINKLLCHKINKFHK